MKTALITGVTGQDGAYLTRFLLNKNYNVHGIVPYCEVDNTLRLKEEKKTTSFYLHRGDLLDSVSLNRIINQVQPDEIYNLAAQSHVGSSFEVPEQTMSVNNAGVIKLLEAIRLFCPKARFYQASSSEMFGNVDAPQTELSPMRPCSPYAVAKLSAYHLVSVYRQSYGLHASNGILFNHESPIRGEDFVTRKISKVVAKIANGHKEILCLGNLEAKRDWGHAQDYVRGMWLMLQQDEPDDYILATGRSISVRELVEKAFAHVNIDIVWQGGGLEEVGLNLKTREILIKIDPQFYRPNELHTLCGDASKAEKILRWKPEISFEEMIAEMIAADRGEEYNQGWMHAA